MEQRKVVPPGEEELRTYSLGKCEPQRATEIEAFLADGPDCSPILETAPEDALLRYLRGAGELSTGDAPPTDVPGYEVLVEVGRGGMGVVYKARHIALNRLVALKMILAGGHAGSAELLRFRQEAATVAQLQHPNIVQIYEVGAHNGLPYLALEYIEGGNLAQTTAGAPQPAQAAAGLVELLARAVDHAHQNGVIHRDLKPANVLLTAGGAPKLSDFGLARRAGDTRGMTATGAVLGTPGYLAPEQADAHPTAFGPPTDVYGLGAVLYYLLTGRPPFQGALAEIIRQTLEREPVRPTQLQPGIPRDLETICLKCLQKEPAKRYATALALAEDLRRFQAGESIAARPVGVVERLWRWRRRNPAVALLSAAAVLMLIAVTVVSVVFAVTQGNAARTLQAEKDKTDLVASQLRTENDRAEAALKESHRNEALLTGDRAIRICEEGMDGQASDPYVGLLWLARAVEMAPEDDEQLQHLLRANWAAWQTQVCAQLGALSVPEQQKQRRLGSFVVWSPDGRQVLAGGDGGLEIWEVRSWRKVRTRPFEGKTNAVAWSVNGRFAASGGPAGVPVRIWNLDDDAVRELDSLPGVWDLNFSPDSSQLAAACADGTIRFWDVRTGDAVGGPMALKESAEPAFSVAYQPGGRRLLTATATTVQQWDAVKHTAIGLALSFPEKGLRCARYSADGKRFCLTCYRPGYESSVLVCATNAGRPEHGFPVSILAGSVGLSPDGDRFVVGLNSCRAEVWDVAGPTLRCTIAGHDRPVMAAAISPDGRAILTGGSEGSIRVSAFPDGAALPPFTLSFPEPQGPPLNVTWWTADGVRCLAASPDGRLLFAGGWDRNGLLVGAEDGAVRGQITGHVQVVTAAAFTPDGKRLLTGSADKTVRLWDLDGGRLAQGPWTFEDAIRYLALSPDGSSAVVSEGKTASLLHLGRANAVADKLWAFSRGAAFLPNGKGVLVGQPNGANLWDLETGKFSETSLPHTSSVCAVAVDAAGKRAATGAWRVGQIWDLETGVPIGPPLRHNEMFNSLAFSPDGRLVASLAFTGEARFWDAATGRPVGPVLTHPGPGNALVFHPNGSVLFTTSSTPMIYRWRVPRPVTEAADRLTLRTQVLTGLELDAQGVVHRLSADVWRERRQRLEELAPGTVRYLEP